MRYNTFKDKNIVGSDVSKYCRYCNKGALITQCCNEEFYEQYRHIKGVEGYISCWEVKECPIRAEICRNLHKRDIK